LNESLGREQASALLDNAPNYLTFLAGALDLPGPSMDNPAQMSEFLARHDHHLVVISMGATCFAVLTSRQRTEPARGVFLEINLAVAVRGRAG